MKGNPQLIVVNQQDEDGQSQSFVNQLLMGSNASVLQWNCDSCSQINPTETPVCIKCKCVRGQRSLTDPSSNVPNSNSKSSPSPNHSSESSPLRAEAVGGTKQQEHDHPNKLVLYFFRCIYA